MYQSYSQISSTHKSQEYMCLSWNYQLHQNRIPSHAAIMQPITRVTKKETPFAWGQEQKESFNTTLAAVADSILCIYPNPNRPFVIHPDTSQKCAMGAMLAQVQDRVEQIVSTFCPKPLGGQNW